MAITGVFAGEFFNTMIGFGLYGVRYNTTYNKPVNFALFDESYIRDNIFSIVIMVFMLINLIQNFIYLAANKWDLKSPWW